MRDPKKRGAPVKDCTQDAICEITKNGVLAAVCKRHKNLGRFVRNL